MADQDPRRKTRNQGPVSPFVSLDELLATRRKVFQIQNRLRNLHLHRQNLSQNPAEIQSLIEADREISSLNAEHNNLAQFYNSHVEAFPDLVPQIDALDQQQQQAAFQKTSKVARSPIKSSTPIDQQKVPSSFRPNLSPIKSSPHQSPVFQETPAPPRHLVSTRPQQQIIPPNQQISLPQGPPAFELRPSAPPLPKTKKDSSGSESPSSTTQYFEDLDLNTKPDTEFDDPIFPPQHPLRTVPKPVIVPTYPAPTSKVFIKPTAFQTPFFGTTTSRASTSSSSTTTTAPITVTATPKPPPIPTFPIFYTATCRLKV